MKRRFRGLLLAGIVVAALGGATASPAGATTNEQYVRRVYQDFLLRQPTTNELNIGIYALATGSRAAYVDYVLAGDAFLGAWVQGIEIRYLGDASSPADQAAAVAALKGDRNFVGSEARVLSSQEYFDDVDDDNSSYVESLFDDILNRDADPSGLGYWTGRLASGTSRSSVAAGMIRSAEAARLRVAGPSSAAGCAATVLSDVDAVSSGSFCLVLDRMADPSGKTYWTNQLAASSQLPELWSSLASSNEYFTLAGQ